MNDRGAIILGQPTDTPTGFELDVKAQFAATWDRLDMAEERILSAFPKPPPQPVHGRTVGSTIANSAGFGVIDLSGPPMGHVWDVMALTVGGLITTATATGRADLFASTTDYRQFASLAAPGTSEWRDFTTTLPNAALYNLGQVFLRGPERLYIVISGGTAGQEYVAAASMIDNQEAAVLRVATSG